VQEILPGVWHWTAQHPDIPYEVSSYYLAGAAAVLDPVLPDEGLDALDGHPVEQVILTNRLHGRHTDRFVDAFGARVRAPRVGLHQFEGRSYAVEPYDFGDELAPGVRSHELGAISPDDGVLHLEAEGALHFADGLLVRNGELCFMPDDLMDDLETVKRVTRERLGALADELDFDILLFAHSDPIISGGRAQLEALIR
jgi:glyoxylase-like metal-dependent hydrolase (beta-lactamase superfamily II)